MCVCELACPHVHKLTCPDVSSLFIDNFIVCSMHVTCVLHTCGIKLVADLYYIATIEILSYQKYTG